MDLPSTPTFEPVCSGLKVLFETVTEDPLPTQWEELTLALDAALASGDLYEAL